MAGPTAASSTSRRRAEYALQHAVESRKLSSRSSSSSSSSSDKSLSSSSSSKKISASSRRRYKLGVKLSRETIGDGLFRILPGSEEDAMFQALPLKEKMPPITGPEMALRPPKSIGHGAWQDREGQVLVASYHCY